MIIEVDRIPKEGLKIHKEFDFFWFQLVEENSVFLEPAHVDAMIKKAGEEIFIKGKITTCVSFICSRCLVPFKYPIDSRFDLIYIPEEAGIMKEKLEQEDMNKSYYHSRKINVDEIVLEQLNLTFPVKPVCSESCQGICANCGNLIQEGRCSCVKSESDPRLGKLKIFLKDKT